MELKTKLFILNNLNCANNYGDDDEPSYRGRGMSKETHAVTAESTADITEAVIFGLEDEDLDIDELIESGLVIVSYDESGADFAHNNETYDIQLRFESLGRGVIAY